MDTFLGALVQGILLGGVYSLLAMGVLVIYKSSKVFNIGYGEIMMFLAYFIWWLLVPRDLPLWIALVLALLVSILMGLSIHRFLLRPMIGQPMMVTFMLCLLLGIAVNGVTILWLGGFTRIMPDFLPSGNLAVGGISVSYTLLISFIIAIAMFVIFVLYFRYSRIGLGMRCVSEDNYISQSLGINVKRIFALSWAIGCLSAAISGILLGSLFVVDTRIGMFAIIRALPVLLLGGLESIPGALIGAIFVGVTEVLASTYVDPHVTGFRDLLPFILMVLILIIRPHGLFGLRTIERI